jgi:hypothetical protein
VRLVDDRWRSATLTVRHLNETNGDAMSWAMRREHVRHREEKRRIHSANRVRDGVAFAPVGLREEATTRRRETNGQKGARGGCGDRLTLLEKASAAHSLR